MLKSVIYMLVRSDKTKVVRNVEDFILTNGRHIINCSLLACLNKLMLRLLRVTAWVEEGV